MLDQVLDTKQKSNSTSMSPLPNSAESLSLSPPLPAILSISAKLCLDQHDYGAASAPLKRTLELNPTF